MNSDDATHDRVAQYLRLNPNASPVEVVAATDADPQRWREVVAAALDAEEPHVALATPADTAGELVEPTNADNQATATDSTVEDTDPEGATPRVEAVETTTRNGDSTMFDADYSTVDADTYQPDLHAREQWMGRRGKLPFAPWGDADPDDADPEDSPRWEWGRTENHVDGDTVAMAEADARLDGRVFIQRESDPFAFVDGDDVRDPATGEVHPAFRALLAAFGATYADVSTSGGGVHAYYRADDGLPIDGKGQATFPIDTEPWGENDSPPTVEIYANKHVCVATGDHVGDTPLDLTEWDTDAVRAALEANGYDDEEPVAHDTDHDRADLAEHDPVATDADDNTREIRDVLAAVDKLEPRDLPLRTRRTGEDSTGWSTWNPSYRSSESGESLHYNGEGAFHDHKKGEAFGVLSLFAAEEGIISNPWDRLADADFWAAVDAAREAGAPIPEYVSTDDAEAVAPIAVAKLDALDSTERRRAARKRGLNIPSTDDARERLRNSIMREIRNGNTTVLDAPTALGKSYTVATEPWLRRESTTGGQPVIHLHQTREARDEAAAATNDSMAVGAVLRGRKEASPVAGGDHDPAEDPEVVVTVDGDPASEWFDRMCDDKGLAFSTALALATERNDQGLDELPPFGVDDPAVAQWGDIPRGDDGDPAADVIHATHQFAHVPSIRSNTNIVLDEQADFRKELSQDRVRRMVNAYLKEIGAPVTNYEAFVTLAEHDATRGDAAAERDALDSMLEPDSGNPPTEWFVEEPDAHALAAGITRGIWNALRWEEPDSNGRRATKVYHEPPRFDADGSEYAAGTWLSVVVDDDHTIRSVRATPDLRQARAVVGLDAHPSMPLWELNAAPGMTHDAVLDATERRMWRRYERGLQVVQVGEATRPRSGDNALDWMNDDRVRAVLNRLREHYGEGFKTALSTVQTERRLRELLREVGVDAADDSTMHYGEEKSRNDYAEEAAGYVYGCMDPGDDMVLDALAELGLDAEPTTVETDAGDLKREKGRTFDGPDADTAGAVLASVRENHVAQAAGRYARDAEGDHGATVYLHTDAAPTGFVDADVPGVEWVATDLQREILDELAARPSATATTLAEAVDCSKDHVHQTLKQLSQQEEPVVERHERAGEHGADVFRAEESVVDEGEVVDTADNRLLNPNRWSSVVSFRHTENADRPAASEPSPSTVEAIAGGDGPPDPGD